MIKLATGTACLLLLSLTGCGDEEPATCYGCFEGGECLAGDSARACGSGGVLCIDCPAGQSCQDGKCRSACPGCLAGGACLPGMSKEACGSGGSECLACQPGESCMSQTCQQVCNAESCLEGCCRDGVCEPGLSPIACGGGGAACATCTTTEECAQRECVPKQVGCTGCQGCCSSDSKCLSGDKVSACGKGGQSCAVCPAEHSCVDGVCKPNPTKCDAVTCAQGCCTSTGVCIPFAQQNLQQCGKAGGVCSVCGGAATCVQGTCVQDQPCFSFCQQGCCTSQGVCLSYASQDKTSCGGGGALCTSCPTGQNCLSGSCVNDPVWDIYAVSAVIAATKPSGSNWDSWPQNPLPDGYLMLCLGSPTVCLPSSSKNIDNTLTPYWNEKIGSWKETELISKGLTIWVMDDDNLGNNFNDQIGQCTLSLTSTMLQSGQHIIASCGSASKLTLKFVKQ